MLLLETPPRALDPRFVTDSSSTKVSKLIFAGLTAVETPDLTPAPDLAERVESACDDGPEGRVGPQPGHPGILPRHPSILPRHSGTLL